MVDFGGGFWHGHRPKPLPRRFSPQWRRQLPPVPPPPRRELAAVDVDVPRLVSCEEWPTVERSETEPLSATDMLWLLRQIHCPERGIADLLAACIDRRDGVTK